MHVDPSKPRRHYWALWQVAMQKLDEARRAREEMRIRLGGREAELRQLREELAEARARPEQHPDRVHGDRTAYRTHQLVQAALRFIRENHPGCTCGRWEDLGRHTLECAIMQRLELDRRAGELGIGRPG